VIPPVEVSEIVAYRDGGTIGMQMVDRLGSELPLCLDGRVKGGRNAKKPFQLYLGARHPTHPHARAIPVGGKEERAILGLLEQAQARTQAGEAHGMVEGQARQMLESVIGVLRARQR
jgi:hypothetical protein